MNASKRHGAHGRHGTLRKLSNKSASAVKKTFLTLGDLISAVYDVTGSTDGAARLLDSDTPLARALRQRIIVAT